MKKIELLAPAGDLEKLKIAILYGADAVYIGGDKFGLRANATNFNLDEIKKAANFAHAKNCKIYVTLNAIFHNEDIEGLKEYLQDLSEASVDAIIVSDLIVLKMANEVIPHMPIHISTQSSTINYEAVNYLESLAVERVILGREVSLEDIKEIVKRTNVELETFVHGAMCINYSGRCALSNYFTNRDANRGGCAHPCRWEYDLYEEKELASNTMKFSMCPKDLILTEHIPDLIECGVTSLKIEGRMKSIYYIATVIHIYRKIIDEYLHKKEKYKYNKENEIILNKCAGRESSTQFFTSFPNESDQYYSLGNDLTNQDFLGIVKDYDTKTKEVIVEVRNYFKVGDTLEIFGPNTKEFSFEVISIKNEDGLVNVANHPLEIIRIPLNTKVESWDMLRFKR